jgi:hypothetical protein
VVTDEFPLWADKFVRELLWELGLDEFRVKTVMHRVIEGDEDRAADINVQAEYLAANMRVRDDIEDTYFWAELLFHEITHIMHGPIDDFVRNTLIEGMPGEKMLLKAYQHHLERHISTLTRVMMRYRRWLTEAGATLHEPTEGEKKRAVEDRAREVENAVQKQGTSEISVQSASGHSPKMGEGVRKEASDQAATATRAQGWPQEEEVS